MFTREKIIKALNIPGFDSIAAQRKMAPIPRTIIRPPKQPGEASIGAVLLLLLQKDGAVHLLFTKRQDHLPNHPGQISFPGGRREKNEALQETALRETREEIGISSDDFSVLGRLKNVYIPPSDFIVHPFVAWHAGIPVYRHDPKEVAEIIEKKLSCLFDPANRATEERQGTETDRIVPYVKIGRYKVWGATAMILSEFLERLKAIKSTES